MGSSGCHSVRAFGAPAAGPTGGFSGKAGRLDDGSQFFGQSQTLVRHWMERGESDVIEQAVIVVETEQ